MLNQFQQWEEIGFIAERAFSPLNPMNLFCLITDFWEFQEHLTVYKPKYYKNSNNKINAQMWSISSFPRKSKKLRPLSAIVYLMA
jgi:hypothetical protein